ncbi:M48 family metallopeptidase [Microbulbifer aggregans]|uniref:M48 family metallopeptidase n=1 Tax=Microbulbifer aggregans TaxID=1769779 RepID=UPI001CFF00CA|nr:M48 family metallopeptidase [Microbulbifer aggregans]
MNFFEHQNEARRSTTLLLTLFVATLLCLVAITTLFAAAILQFSRAQPFSVADIGQTMGWETVAGIAVFITAVVAIASLYKWRQLADGGRTVAEALGGRKINTCAKGANEQQALNVVEEMAIASGTPVPDLYILDDRSINAFAAGYEPGDAVIGITRGCIEQLTREELQGVIAHEFSHILNGDMRRNIQLVGLLHGILIIGLAGYWLIDRINWSSRRGNRGFPATAIIGAGLVAIGYTGTLFGNLIKFAVSRQREYLADASAIQYTRNNQGLASALKKIAGHESGSRISAAKAAEYSHIYFANGVRSSLASLFSTHPPIQRRIRRIDPSWSGELQQREPGSAPNTLSPTVDSMRHHQTLGAHQPPYGPGDTVDCETLTDVIDNRIGKATSHQCALAQQLLANTPQVLQNAARDPFAARALVYALLLHPDQRTTQLELLNQIAHPAVMRTLLQLLPSIDVMDKACRLPLLDLCVPALKDLVPQQYQVFKRNLIKLLRSDARVDIWEWALYRVLMHALEGRPDRQRLSKAPQALDDACRYLLAAMAHTGNAEYLPAKRAYDQGLRALGMEVTPLPAKSDILLQRLDKALVITEQLPPLKKPSLLKAIVMTLAHNGAVSPAEFELLRAMADCLNCPMPPLLPPGSGCTANVAHTTVTA